MIAVTFALPTESSAFLRLLRNRKRRDFITSGTLHGHDVRVVHTGVGEKAARARIAAFFRTHTPTVLISAGFAGATGDELQTGDVLLAENYSTPRLQAEATAALADRNVRVGRLGTAPAIVDTAAERKAFARRTKAWAVDMETAFIAQACVEYAIPMLSLRVISDTPAAPLPLSPKLLFDLKRQRTNYATLALHLAKHPRAIPRMVAFARQIAAARRSLADALDLVLRRPL